MTEKQFRPAIAFLRRTGAGRAKPAEPHRKLLAAFADASGYTFVAEFSERMGTGAAFPNGRGFSALLRHVETTGTSTVIVASASEFAPDRLVRAVGYAALRKCQIELLAADDPYGFYDPALPPELVDQVLKLNASFDKLLARAYRDAAHERPGIDVGPRHRKRFADMLPEAVALAKSLHQQSQRKSIRMSVREISAKLAEVGQLNKSGKPYHPEEIRRMIKGPRPRGVNS